MYARTGQTCMAVVKQNEKLSADYQEGQQLCAELTPYFGSCHVEDGPTCNGSAVRVKKLGKWVVCVPHQNGNSKGGKCSGARSYVESSPYSYEQYPFCSFQRNKKGEPKGEPKSGDKNEKKPDDKK